MQNATAPLIDSSEAHQDIVGQTSERPEPQRERYLFPNLHSMIYEGPKRWRGELSAGITTAALLIPQSMAYATLAGLPPYVGLYAAMAPILIYAILGTSRSLSVGPVAMDSMLTYATLGGIATVMTTRYIELAGVFALAVGMMLILMSALRFGKIAALLRPAMMSGFTSAAAFMIAFSQLKPFLGAPMERRGTVQAVCVELYHKISLLSPMTLLIGLASLIIFQALPKLKGAERLPVGLMGVTAMTVISALFGLESAGVGVVGDIPSGLPSLVSPSWDVAQSVITGEHSSTFISGVISVAILAFMEAAAVGQVVARSHGYKIRPGQEMLALGASNLMGAIFGGYPVTGGLSRTAVNDRAGARTPLASMITLVLIALVLWRLTPILYALPLATLAAMIINAVIKLIDFKTPREMWRVDRLQSLIWLVTFGVTLTLGLQIGIMTGIIVSLLSHIPITVKRSSKLTQ